jgi:formylglycine-generating enzyme required for sulfatase activity
MRTLLRSLSTALVTFSLLAACQSAGVHGSGRPDTGDETSIDLPGGIPVRFVYVRGGTFMMGAPADEPDREVDENYHQVTLTKDFWCGKFEITNRQFRAFRPDHKSWGIDGEKGEFNGDDQPVVCVDIYDAQAFVKWAAEKTGRKIRLLTEAEWEYACRAGSTGQYCFGNDRSQLGDYCWYTPNSGGQSHPVGTKKPNAWGIHDMHGNVAEWVNDWYGGVPTFPVVDPVGPPTSGDHCWRECSWSSQAFEARCAVRDYSKPTYKSAALGIRLACDP